MLKRLHRYFVVLLLMLSVASMYKYCTTPAVTRLLSPPISVILPFYYGQPLRPVGWYHKEDYFGFYISYTPDKNIWLALGHLMNEWQDYKLCTIVTQEFTTGSNPFLPELIRTRRIQFFYWQAAILTAIYPTLYVIGFALGIGRRKLRQSVQGCVQCGYDLQGNQSGVCPECGKTIEQSSNPEGTG